MSIINDMDRRIGARINTDFRLRSFRDGHSFECRAVDLSATGALIRHDSIRSWPMVQQVELQLDREHTLSVTARTVWCFGELQAVRFVELSDVDRLDIAEHIDRVSAKQVSLAS